MQDFTSLGLSEELIRALKDLSITEPTPIQEQAIPILVNEATDFLGLAQTGTGKTASFGLPLIEQVDHESKVIQAIILSPTRELAQQLCTSLDTYLKYTPKVKSMVVYGGANIQNQIKSLQRRMPQILVATPGRMLDLINRKVLNLTNVRFVVLDEADEMLNMGFKADIDTILSFTQHDKNIWLFSATMPKDIRRIVEKFMSNPKEINIRSEVKVNQNIAHRYTLVRRDDKSAALQRIIDAEGEMYALIFCRTKAETQRLSDRMAKAGYPVEAIHGDLSQAQRDTVMKKFKSGSVKLLAATDVAARGIDVDNLSHVIHYDLPDDLAFYTHRSGRTGRAGNSGVTIAMMTPAEHYKVRNLEKQLGISFEKIKIPSMEEVYVKHIQAKMDDVLSTEANEDALAWAFAYSDQIEHISKEEILAKVITKSMGVISSDQTGDLNAPERGERDRRDKKGNRRDGGRRNDRRDDRGRRNDRRDDRRDDRGGRNDRRAPRGRDGKEEGMVTFKINIGKEDHIEKGELLKLICDATGVRSKHIGRIDMFRDASSFDVRKEKAKGVEFSFKGLKMQKRAIRVNRS